MILDRDTEIDPVDPKALDVVEVRGDIALKHVSFAYPSRPDTVIFKDFSLKVRAGKSLALVGTSGSGIHFHVSFFCLDQKLISIASLLHRV